MKADLSKATPRPWRAALEPDDRFPCRGNIYGCGVIVAAIGENYLNAEANTALIVEAVNAYDTAQKLAEAVLAIPTDIPVSANNYGYCTRVYPNRREWDSIVALAREFQKEGGV